jgi:hypothetical protein
LYGLTSRFWACWIPSGGTTPSAASCCWQTTERLASERTIAGLEVEPQRQGYPVNYILDGQQRVATICGALHWRPEAGAASRWCIVYDLASQEFRHVATFDDQPAHVMPIHLMSDPAEYFGRVALLTDQDQAQRAKTLFDRLMGYQVAVVTIQRMSVREVAKIFERINSTQTPLTVVDLMRAATWTNEFDLQDKIDTLLMVLDRKNGRRGV